MSYAIGRKIKELRQEKSFSQDYMAERLDMTRQRYSRIENGQIDISYVILKEISDIFGLAIKDITNVEDEYKELVTFFREKSDDEEIFPLVSKIEEILKVFNAHEKLYYSMEERDCNEL